MLFLFRRWPDLTLWHSWQLCRSQPSGFILLLPSLSLSLIFYFHFFTLFNFYSYFHFPSWQLWRSQLFHLKPSFLSFLSLYRSFPVCFHLAGILIALLSGFGGILQKTKQCSWMLNSFWETDLGSKSVQSGCNYLNPEDSQSYLNVGISTNFQFSQSRYKWISHKFVTPMPSIHPL